MKIIRKISFVIILLVSLFVLDINIVRADYKATTLNPAGAKCSLNEKSTGFCFYENKNLNSIESHTKWLDNGDEVTVISNVETVKTNDPNLCADYYVYVSYYHSYYNATFKGYYCNAYLKTDTLTDELKTEFKNLGFPESYWNKLATLKTAHPNWNFKAINTDLNFNDAVNGEASKAGWSLIQKSSSNNYAYMSYDSTSFDYENDVYIPYDNTSSSDAWYNANYDTVAYYMDPRNFLMDMYIFQYEGLSYDDKISNETYTTIVSGIFGNDYLSKYTDIFVKAGPESLVSPVYLAALSKQEVGGSEKPTTAVAGEYNKMYNFYNIGSTGGDEPVKNGLNFAKETDAASLRPWDTEEKAIIGGAMWIGDQYISIGQDTSYFKKWNVVYNYIKANGKNPIFSNYNHQYMTNVLAPSSEAITTYNSLSKNNLLDIEYTFYIPVYKNMPLNTTLPSKGGWPNNYLASISINNKNIIGFDSEVTTYNYYIDINTSSVKINAKPISDKAKVTGNETFNLTGNVTKKIIVTAENGNKKEYTINFIVQGEKKTEPETTDPKNNNQVDPNSQPTPTTPEPTPKPIEEKPKEIILSVQETLNKAGIKNGTYITGLNVDTDIKIIKDKILDVNPKANVTLTNSSNKAKDTGKICTGDKVTITSGSETKTYEIVLYGDTNGDGKIAASDYVKIKNHIMGKTTLSGAYSTAADVNKDGKIAASDYVKIKNQIMGKGTITQ